jgi:hypothetical protein
MFTGFASENTPAIQVWDFVQTFASTSAVRSISLADDCAPIQHFKTGGTFTAINLYLPSAPIEGKQIKIINANYSGANQDINIYSSDPSGSGTSSPFIVIGSGQTLDLCYSKNTINTAAGVGQFLTGWISLNQSHIGAFNFNSVVLGGNNNLASNSRCAVLGGSSNTASGSSSAVVGGGSNSATNTNGFVGGGSGNSTSGIGGAVIGGQNNSAPNNNSFACGSINTSNATNSIILGGAWGTARSIQGNTVAPASVTPITFTQGASQSALLVLGVETTDATATKLRSNTSAASGTNQVILPNNSAYVFQGTCIANVTGGSTTSGWKYEGVIKRGANAASTTLVAAVTPTVIAQDALANTWVLAITADVTNGGIAVTVTGAAATTIRWVSKIETTEVTY